MAISELVREHQWLINLTGELFGTINAPTAIPIYTDSESAISIAGRDGSDGRTKHINVRYHIIKQALKDGTTTLDWVPTTQQLADILTKPVRPLALYQSLRDQLLYHSNTVVDSGTATVITGAIFKDHI